MSWLTSNFGDLGATAAKAALMYTTAVVGLRLSERRILAQWSTIDFAVAVAVGAIIGRTAVASNQSFVTGAVALLVLLALHRLMSLGRSKRWFTGLVDHRVLLLVRDGKVLERELHRCGLTEDDLSAHLRERGVLTLADVKYVVYEAKGGITVVPATTSEPAELLDGALRKVRAGSQMR